MGDTKTAPLTSKPKLIGSSYDLRTNRWRITCPKCGHQFEPPTTMFAIQHLDCPKPKCSVQLVADYNEEIVIALEDEGDN